MQLVSDLGWNGIICGDKYVTVSDMGPPGKKCKSNCCLINAGGTYFQVFNCLIFVSVLNTKVISYHWILISIHSAREITTLTRG